MPLLEIKTVTITEKGQISIPLDIRKREGFRVGSKVAILAFQDKVELRPLKKLNEPILTALASEKVLAKDWSTKEEDKAWAHL
ncbi:AbrB/MazE/SpoVT family DNA-binding domain-containing protein [Candidatus Woesearchaeota archaeon]|nr:AbrB/MazE/SpoVT family DNA-binding domain-containing protein [Candidatus Woesearchaeota archaeon]